MTGEEVKKIRESLGLNQVGFGNRTTAIYIDFDLRKVDAANRRVMDWVLYGRR